MTAPSRVRPRPRPLRVETARFILSVAAIVRNGLHVATDAYTLPMADVKAKRLSPMQQSSGTGSFFTSMQTTPDWDYKGPDACVLPARGLSSDPATARHSNCPPDSSRRETALMATAAALAPTLAVLTGEEADVTSEEEVRHRPTLGSDGCTKIALGERPVAKRMTVPEEAKLVEEVKTLVGYLKIRERIADELHREPSHQEWAESCGLSMHELAAQWVASQRAQERIVESNIGLIFLVARRHHPLALREATIANDLVQEGSIALLRAAETFDPQLGYRFATYAGWWVRDRVQRCIVDQARFIRLPQHVHNFRRSVANAEVVLRKELGRRPTPQEIADHMMVDVARVMRYSNCPETLSLDDTPLPSSRKTLGSSSSGMASGGPGRGASRALGKMGAGYRHEKVACSHTSPEQEADAVLFQVKLDKLMSVLSEDERLVVSLRYGLGGVTPETLKEVAERAGSTKHRVRMVETRALNKLRRRPVQYPRARATVALASDVR